MKSGLDRFLIGITVIGVILSGVSLFRGILMRSQVQVEYLENGEGQEKPVTTIFVDIEGAVEKPGVYELAENSRIKDVLIMAGGFSQDADREYGEKNINLVQVLKDGQKIYIPKMDDTPGLGGYSEANFGRNMINVNIASVKELDTLWGVGKARAESIVKNRPYTDEDDLLKRGGITKQIVENNKGRLSF